MDYLRRFASWLDRPLFPWKRLVLSFSLGHFVLENYIAWRQYRVLCQTKVPKALESEIDQKTYDKSQAYGRAKAKFGLVSGIWGQTKEMAIIYYDLYPKLWSLAGVGLTYILPASWRGEITQSLLFIFAYSFAETILSLPFSYYHTFVLEEHYGFNKQTLGLWISDMLKGQALGVAFGVPLGSAFLWIIQRTGDAFFYYIWLFMLAVQIVGVTIYPVFIVPLFNKLTPLEPGPLREKVEALAEKLKFPLSELQVIDGSKRSAHSNAYFTGLPFLKKKIVLYDTLIEKSEDREVEAVLAHELGHWSLGHVPRLLLISQVQTFYIFLLFSVFIRNKSMYTDFGFTKEQPIIVGLILFNGILSPTEPVIQLLMHMLTRKYEYEADAFSKRLNYSYDLGRSLIKLQVQNLSTMDADWMYSSYHYSHPILTERLRAIGWERQKGEDKTDNKQTDGDLDAYTKADRASGREL
ncbi:MAG: hypothetical protein Q9165_002064 [Trypethelium subeluteriae]